MEYYKVEEREDNPGNGSDIREYQGKSETKKQFCFCFQKWFAIVVG